MAFQGIVCPHCGYDGSRDPKEAVAPFLYVEDIECWRSCLGVKGGKLRIHGFYQTGEGYDDGTNPRLECGDCLKDFPVPENMEIEWL